MPNKTIPIQPAPEIQQPEAPAGGLGSLRGAASALRNNGILPAVNVFPRLNQPQGVDCPGCAYPDSPTSKSVDFCEQGAWAVAHEATPKRADAHFFATHTLTELRQREHWELEAAGRLTTPMHYDAASDTYQPIAWEQAFQLAASALHALDDPNQAVFYASGRSSNEAAFPYQLFARVFGTNNMPDSSNYCHESSGDALKASIGVGKSTVTREDFEHADAIFVFGQNPATNHPRMLTDLREAKRRGCRIVVVNALQERGLQAFTDPQSPLEMATGASTPIADLYLQVRIGGDLAALTGILRALFETDAARTAGGQPSLFDHAFIEEHTQGFSELRDTVLQQAWERIETESGLTRAQIEQAAQIYAESKAVIATWCMGLTQHEFAIATIQTLVNLMLVRGNVGKPGAGLMPVRGHSNVQGDRTVGVTNRPKAAWLDALSREFGFEPPREAGLDAAGTIRGLLEGRVRAFTALGGNFAVAGPDSERVLAAMRNCALTVHIATKLNRTHLFPGRTGLLLPCLGRTEQDVQASGAQFVSVEDTASMVHASTGRNRPASEHLRSEPWIVAELAHHTLGSEQIDWRAMAADYDRTRAAIERVTRGVVEGFDGYNERIRKNRGFHLPNAAAERRWDTVENKAVFTPHPLPARSLLRQVHEKYGDQVLVLATVRAHRQYNTTVYHDRGGEVDRYRGVHGTRRVLFISQADLDRFGLKAGEIINLRAAALDGIERKVEGLKLVAYPVHSGDVFGYFPELTPLLAPEMTARGSNTPTFKGIPVLIER